MKRALVILSMGFALMTSAHASGSTERYPTRGWRGTLDLQAFMSRDDPVAAAVDLLHEIERQGLDLDDSRHFPPALVSKPGWVVELPFGELAPTDGDRSYLAELEAVDPKSMHCSILQTTRFMSLREIVELMQLGVRLRDGVGLGAQLIIASASVTQVIASYDFVRWIGAYRPEYKLVKHLGKSLGHVGYVVVHPFGPAADYMAQDLDRAGVKVFRVQGEGYMIEPTSRAVKDAAAMWWVHKIVPELVVAPTGGRGAPSN